MGRSNIEYLDWNITCVEGCTPISAGCANCYAQAYLKRFHKPMGVTLHPERLEIDMASLARIKEPQVVGIAFTGDLFHEDVPFFFIDRVGDAIGYIPQHTYIFLTKRADRMLEYFDQHCVGELPGNIWPMVSVEDQKSANDRIPFLLQIAAAHHGVSIEPMLGPVDLTKICHDYEGARFETNALSGIWECINSDSHDSVGLDDTDHCLDWVVIGGESGPGARPMHPDWARKIRDDCKGRCKFMFKQWGEWANYEQKPSWEGGNLPRDLKSGRVIQLRNDLVEDGHFRKGDMYLERVGKKRAGRLLDGVQHTDGPGKL